MAAFTAAEVSTGVGLCYNALHSVVNSHRLSANLSDTASDEQSMTGLGGVRRLRPPPLNLPLVSHQVRKCFVVNVHIR